MTTTTGLADLDEAQRQTGQALQQLTDSEPWDAADATALAGQAMALISRATEAIDLLASIVEHHRLGDAHRLEAISADLTAAQIATRALELEADDTTA